MFLRHFLPRLVGRPLTIVGAVMISCVLLIWIFENRLIFFPPRFPEGFSPLEGRALRPEEVWLTTEDGVRLNAYFLRASESRKVLLWFHGNAENIGMGLDQMATFQALGINILAVDYRGYGKSEGKPDEAGVYRDGEASFRYLTESRHFDPMSIFIYGHSLGGAVAIDLASRRECGGLIVESSFTSIREMVRKIYPVPLLEYVPQSRFDSISKIVRVRAPVLIIHGQSDEVIPFKMGQELYRAAHEPKAFLAVRGAGHNDVFLVGGPEYIRQLKNFIDSSSPAPEPVPGSPQGSHT